MKILTIQTVLINKYAERSNTPYKNKYLEVQNQEHYILNNIDDYKSFLKKYKHIVPVKFDSTCQRIELNSEFDLNENKDPSLYFKNGLYFDGIYDAYYIIYIICNNCN
jgi:hypothetical protein